MHKIKTKIRQWWDKWFRGPMGYAGQDGHTTVSLSVFDRAAIARQVIDGVREELARTQGMKEVIVTYSVGDVKHTTKTTTSITPHDETNR